MSRTILITGASSGIGKATAIHFQQQGWNVIATMRSPEKETELNKLKNVYLEKLDVLDLVSVDKAINNGIQKFRQIDALLNNAGYGAYGPLETFPRENIIRQFNTNVIGLIDVTKAIIPHFRQKKTVLLSIFLLSVVK
jgi:NADP-dependent 3-hydroxy acid dehydrogenase YdfG